MTLPESALMPRPSVAADKAEEKAPDRASSAEIGQSLSGRRWFLPPSPSEKALLLMRQAALPETVAVLLAERGISPENAEDYFTPRLKNLLPDPSVLKDLDLLTERLAKAVQNHETVAVFGDYDVDGVTSTALLTSALKEIGVKAIPYIPDRMKEGYGPNLAALQKLIDRGTSLIICADCGATAFHIFNEVKVDLAVIDHHKLSETALTENGTLKPFPPSLLAMVNPQRPDDLSRLTSLCTAGLAFLVLIGLWRTLRRQDFFKTLPEPDLKQNLDLVALATICDVMPLKGLNRAFVAQGLKVMSAPTARQGIKALIQVCKLSLPLTARHCGFALGPRLNAAGRIFSPDIGVKLLLSTDPENALSLATVLDEMNKERQAVQESVLQEAAEQAEKQQQAGAAAFFVYGENWHPGVAGIVAGRLKERFNRPVCVGAVLQDRIVGSARSIEGFDIGHTVLAAKEAGILEGGGGHTMAAGFSLSVQKKDLFQDFLNQTLREAAFLPPLPDLKIEAVCPVAGATEELTRHFSALEPYGSGNREPLLMLFRARVVSFVGIGADKQTLQLFLTGEQGGRLKALLFRADENPLTPFLKKTEGKPLHLVGYLRTETFKNFRSTTFFISDAVFA